MNQIYVVLTETCNLTCHYCIRESSPKVKTRMLVEDAFALIDEIHLAYPSSTIGLTGGEPTLHPQFKDILSYTLRKGQKVSVNTNGTTAFFRKYLSEFSNTDNLSFQVSLDGIESKHDEIRGKGTYHRSLRSLELAVKLGIKCCVSITVSTTDFFDDAEQFLNGIDNIGLQHIAIKIVTFAGRASDGSDITIEKWNDFVRYVRSRSYKTKIIINPMYDFETLSLLSAHEINEIADRSNYKNCGAGSSKIYVYPNLNVCTCTCFRDIPIGTLKDESLESIMENLVPFTVGDSRCVNCRYYKLCNGGCLGSGFQFSGRIGEPDPRCPTIRENNTQIIESIQVT